jgi:dihydropteroate synthase
MTPPATAPTTQNVAPARPLPRLLGLGRALVMGVLNVTPDSFSDAGQFLDPEHALAQARRLVAEGADLIDVGAESTRPYGGMAPVTAEEEWRRLAPVLPAVISLGVPVSIDTMKAEVATKALSAGAVMVNDVWGLQRDPAMAPVIAASAVPIVIMHNREAPDPAIDIMDDIVAFFFRSLDIAARAGIARDDIVLDPGIGFGKTPDQSIITIGRFAELQSFKLPLLIGASRKRFIDKISPAPPDRRLGGSLASHLSAVASGAAIVRTHDVAETVQALRVAAAIGAAR